MKRKSTLDCGDCVKEYCAYYTIILSILCEISTHLWGVSGNLTPNLTLNSESTHWYFCDPFQRTSILYAGRIDTIYITSSEINNNGLLARLVPRLGLEWGQSPQSGC